MNYLAMASTLNPSYSDAYRVPMITMDKGKDTLIKRAAIELGIVPSLTEYDQKDEDAAFKAFRSKHDRKTAAMYAHVTALIMGSDKYCGNGLAWSMKRAQATIDQLK